MKLVTATSLTLLYLHSSWITCQKRKQHAPIFRKIAHSKSIPLIAFTLIIIHSHKSASHLFLKFGIYQFPLRP